MNPKSKVKVLHSEAVIEVNTTFAKMMENPLSEEYRLLQELRRDYPVYSVSRRQIRKNSKGMFMSICTRSRFLPACGKVRCWA